MNKVDILKELSLIADELDQKSLIRESNVISDVMIKVAQWDKGMADLATGQQNPSTPANAPRGSSNIDYNINPALLLQDIMKSLNIPMTSQNIISRASDILKVVYDKYPQQYNQIASYLNTLVSTLQQGQQGQQQGLGVTNDQIVADFQDRVKNLLYKAEQIITESGRNEQNYGGYFQYIQNALNGFIHHSSTSTDYKEADTLLGDFNSMKAKLNKPVLPDDIIKLEDALVPITNVLNEKWEKVTSAFSWRSGYVKKGCDERIDYIRREFSHINDESEMHKHTY